MCLAAHAHVSCSTHRSSLLTTQNFSELMTRFHHAGALAVRYILMEEDIVEHMCGDEGASTTAVALVMMSDGYFSHASSGHGDTELLNRIQLHAAFRFARPGMCPPREPAQVLY